MDKKPEQDNDPTTNVADFFSELDGGQLEHQLSHVLSQVGGAVVDHDRVGEVSIKLKFKRIPGTSQVHCTHTLKFSKPTMRGIASEEASQTTPLHVGKYGRMSLMPESQTSFLTKSGEVKQ